MSVKMGVSESVEVSANATVSVEVSVEASVWAWLDTMFVDVGPSCQASQI